MHQYRRSAVRVLAVVFACAATLGIVAEEEPSHSPRRKMRVYSTNGFYADTFGTSKEPPRFLYSAQEGLEGSLQGDEATRRRVAALLPLRLACQMEETGEGHLWPGDEYILGVLQTIVKEKWQEARPLLAVGFENHPLRERPIFCQRRQLQAASVWLWLSGQTMPPKEEAEFLLRILLGEEASVRPGMVSSLDPAIERETLRVLLQEPREVSGVIYKGILSALKDRKPELKTAGDVDRALMIGQVLGKCFRTGEEELLSIAETHVLFNQVVFLRALRGIDTRTARSDPAFLDACRRLWFAEGMDRNVCLGIRCLVAVQDLWSKVDGADDLVLEFLRNIDSAKDPYAGKDLTWRVISCAGRIQGRRPLGRELAQYLIGMAADERYNTYSLQVAPGVDSAAAEKELRDYYSTYMDARHFLDRVLEAMKKKEQ